MNAWKRKQGIIEQQDTLIPDGDKNGYLNDTQSHGGDSERPALNKKTDKTNKLTSPTAVDANEGRAGERGRANEQLATD